MLFSSEQVSAGHPDKLCDQISDAILTDCLSHDHQSRVAIETMIKDNHVTIAGELTSAHEPDVRELVHRVLAAREPEIRNDFDLTVHISKQAMPRMKPGSSCRFPLFWQPKRYSISSRVTIRS